MIMINKKEDVKAWQLSWTKLQNIFIFFFSILSDMHSVSYEFSSSIKEKKPEFISMSTTSLLFKWIVCKFLGSGVYKSMKKWAKVRYIKVLLLTHSSYHHKTMRQIINVKLQWEPEDRKDGNRSNIFYAPRFKHTVVRIPLSCLLNLDKNHYLPQ